MRYKVDYENRIKKYLEDNNKEYTYCIETMGCALNENDSMKYSGMLESMGFKRVEDIKEANVVLFNTCCIRENAEEKLYGRLGVLKNRKLKERIKQHEDDKSSARSIRHQRS